MSSQLTPEFLADYETPHDLRLSPSGSHVIYTMRSSWVRKHKEDHVKASLWIAEVGKENSARQVSSGKYNDSSPQFSPDGSSISFISDRVKPGKAGALYVMPFKGAGEGLALTNTENDQGVGAYKWSPDGQNVAFTSPDEKSEETKKREEEKDDAKVWGEDWEFSRLRVIEVKTKEVKTVVREDAQVSSFDWSEDGRRIVLQLYRRPLFDDVFTGGKIKVVDVASKELKHICDVNTFFDNLTWHGKWVYWKGQFDGETLQSSAGIWRVKIDTDQAVPEKVAFGETNCANKLSRCGDKLVVLVQAGLSDQLRIIDSGSIFDNTIDISHGWDALLKDGKTTIAVSTALDSGMPLEVFSIVSGTECQLSTHTPQLAKYKLGETSNLRCKASDGLALDGIISVPSSLSGTTGPHPTVLLVHGGPYLRITRGSDAGFHFTEWLLSLGYVVLLPNYRGGSGHGAEFAEAVVGDVGASYSDCIDLLKKGIADGVVDENRVAIAGWSQGGFLSYFAPTRDSTFHFAAAIPGAGISDWDTMPLTSDAPTFETTLNGKPPWLSGTTETRSRKWSAIYHMKDIRTPYLILHGEQDQRVPVEQAVGFNRGLEALGKEAEMVIYPREGHGFPQPFERAHYIHMLKKAKAFLEKHMK